MVFSTRLLHPYNLLSKVSAAQEKVGSVLRCFPRRRQVVTKVPDKLTRTDHNLLQQNLKTRRPFSQHYNKRQYLPRPVILFIGNEPFDKSSLKRKWIRIKRSSLVLPILFNSQQYLPKYLRTNEMLMFQPNQIKLYNTICNK